MDPSPHGDLQWSLCPTCGAWAALSLWDTYLFDLNVTALEEVSLKLWDGCEQTYSD
jgi:hypothetical protein